VKRNYTLVSTPTVLNSSQLEPSLPAWGKRLQAFYSSSSSSPYQPVYRLTFSTTTTLLLPAPAPLSLVHQRHHSPSLRTSASFRCWPFKHSISPAFQALSLPRPGHRSAFQPSHTPTHTSASRTFNLHPVSASLASPTRHDTTSQPVSQQTWATTTTLTVASSAA
jgi:hypothetical protein